MVPEQLLQSLAVRTPSRIVLLVIGGLGGLPMDGRTELAVADTPFLDRLAYEGICGLLNPISPGITPGCAQSCLALLGYDPLRYQVGNGVLEALGLGLDILQGDVVAQGDFATLDARGMIADRFDPNLTTDRNQELCRLIQKRAGKVDEVEVTIAPGHEHRFAVRFRGPNLDPRLTDTDPRKTPADPQRAKALVLDAEATASAVNRFVDQAAKVLSEKELTARTMLLRGFGGQPVAPGLRSLYKLTPVCIASSPLQRGLGRLLGMDLPDVSAEVSESFSVLRREYGRYDFLYLHFDRPHRAGHRGDFDAKVQAIEEIDKQIPHVLAVEPDVIAVCGDHAAPARLGGNSFQPTPCVIWSPYIRPDSVQDFDEIERGQGGLGRILSPNLMPIMLGEAMKLRQYGS